MIAGIFGTGRNGSTLLMRLLDGSPDLWVHPVEVNYLGVLSDLIRFGRVRPETSFNASLDRPLRTSGTVDTETLVRQFSAHVQEMDETYVKHTGGVNARPSNPLGRLGRRTAYTPAEFLGVFLADFRRAYDARGGPQPKYLLFKSIETPFLPDYEHTFPRMRFIHIVRHPIPSYASLKRTNMLGKQWPFWHHGGDELRTLLEMRWIPHARFIAEACARDPGRHFLLRYEDLCRDPAPSILGVCKWLGIRPPKDPTVQTVLGGRRMAKLPSNPSKKGVATPRRVVRDMAQRYGYEDILAARESRFIVLRTKALGRQLGYFEKDGDRKAPNRRALAFEWFLPDKWELKNADSVRGLLAALFRRRWYVYRALLESAA